MSQSLVAISTRYNTNKPILFSSLVVCYFSFFSAFKCNNFIVSSLLDLSLGLGKPVSVG